MKKRFWPVDLLRTAELCSMIGYHFMYDWVYLFGLGSSWYTMAKCYVWQQSICWGFILLSGFSVQFSRSPVKNGLKVAACAALLTVVTWFIPGAFISWGVLHLIASAMLLTALLRPVWQKIPPWLGLMCNGALFVLTKQLPWKVLGFGKMVFCRLPEALYQVPGLFWLGFKTDSYASSDYFPWLPWLFLFWAGYFIGRIFAQHRGQIPERWFTAPHWLEVLTWPGRNSLLVYMLHQVVIYLGLTALCALR